MNENTMPLTLKSPERTAKINKVLHHRQPSLTIVLANIGNEHNVSAIYRTCDAFGVMNVHLYYTHTPFPSIGNSVSASSRKWVQSVRHSSVESLREALSGYQLLATKCSDNAKTMRSYDYTKPTAIILGNEHNGVDEELLPYIDGEVYIPMYGMVQSFNVSVASAILLSECARQREDAGMFSTMQLSQEEYTILMDEWLQK